MGTGLSRIEGTSHRKYMTTCCTVLWNRVCSLEHSSSTSSMPSVCHPKRMCLMTVASCLTASLTMPRLSPRPEPLSRTPTHRLSQNIDSLHSLQNASGERFDR
ncbi:hypothetical protein K443DRAFT_244742 [Laccaria amethystina LaAM-08-1]|uniref:Uncharacterized protein n=1 Tax=Laccaria amethystina LaAM-08-1 TaxID=1095629 RepID=A0A0C9XMW5_9AGAR|nr:hypothetical protein K443DRAFT_244742 [Laccaria amethystina LaAM-08-1]